MKVPYHLSYQNHGSTCTVSGSEIDVYTFHHVILSDSFQPSVTLQLHDWVPSTRSEEDEVLAEALSGDGRPEFLKGEEWVVWEGQGENFQATLSFFGVTPDQVLELKEMMAQFWLRILLPQTEINRIPEGIDLWDPRLLADVMAHPQVRLPWVQLMQFLGIPPIKYQPGVVTFLNRYLVTTSEQAEEAKEGPLWSDYLPESPETEQLLHAYFALRAGATLLLVKNKELELAWEVEKAEI